MGCDTCYKIDFILVGQLGTWSLRCAGDHGRFEHSLPIKGECQDGEPFEIDEDALLQVMEVWPSTDLLAVIERLEDRHLPAYQFDRKKECFFIRGGYLIHFVRPDEDPSSVGVHIKPTIVIDGNVSHNVTIIGAQVGEIHRGTPMAAAPTGNGRGTK